MNLPLYYRAILIEGMWYIIWFKLWVGLYVFIHTRANRTSISLQTTWAVKSLAHTSLSRKCESSITPFWIATEWALNVEAFITNTTIMCTQVTFILIYGTKVNHLQNKWFSWPSRSGFLKTFSKNKVKMPVTSIFTFLHNIFYPIKGRIFFF